MKGKARTAARNEDGSTRQAQVPLHSFYGLVAILSKAAVELPQDIQTILWDIIKARKECALFYKFKRARNVDDIESDKGHQHFIDVLQHYYRTLRRTNQDAPHVNSSQKHEHHMANIFEYLEPEDLEGSDTGPDTSSLAMQNTQPTKYGIEQSSEQQRQEKAFSVFCLLKDLTAIRLFVHRTWREWKERNGHVTHGCYDSERCD